MELEIGLSLLHVFPLMELNVAFDHGKQEAKKHSNERKWKFRFKETTYNQNQRGKGLESHHLRAKRVQKEKIEI